MADNYLQFSEAFDIEHPEILKDIIEKYEKELEEDDDGYDNVIQFEYEFDEKRKTFWAHADECGEPSHLAEVLHRYLKETNSDTVFSFEYAYTCSKMRCGEFGGAAIAISRKKILWSESSLQLVEKLKKQLKCKRTKNA
jgi:hypothetical protein